MDLQNKIYTCRKNAGLSQEALAERIGVSRQAISKWETGEATPEVAKLLSLAKTFGVTTDWMLSDDPDLPANEPETEPIIEEEPPVDDTTAGQSEEMPEPIAEELPPPEQEPVKEDTVTAERDEELNESLTIKDKLEVFVKKIYDRFGAWSGPLLLIFSVLLFIYGYLFCEFALSHFGYSYVPFFGQTNILASYGAMLMFIAFVLSIFSFYLMFAMRKFSKSLTIDERVEIQARKLRKREALFEKISSNIGWTWAILIPCFASLIFSLGLVMYCIPRWFQGIIMVCGFILMCISLAISIIGIIFLVKLYKRVKAKNKSVKE